MTFDWKHPDYVTVFRDRMEQVRFLEANRDAIPALKQHYRQNPADFIDDWGVTYDPRLVEIGLPAMVPFRLFPRQREWVDWVVERWRSRTPGVCEKSRDIGISWLSTALACTLCLFHDGLAIGFGSRKEEYVDKIGTYKPLLPKARMFMEHLPEAFCGGWTRWRDAPHMRINFPESGSIITGEAGNEIGRGDRTGIYFVDEAAHIERPDLVEYSLSQTTNCRIDMSSVRGMNNPFAKKRHEGKISVFVFDWRDDPRKDDAWYAKQREQLDDVVVAQEIDRDYLASVEGVVIPGKWARACLDAAGKLGVQPSGGRVTAVDLADEGRDKNAIASMRGVELDLIEEKSGAGSDLFATLQWAFDHCDRIGERRLRYDADGLGASARGDARVINEQRQAAKLPAISVAAYHGSGAVVDPEDYVDGTFGREGEKGRTNQDYFANLKAQSWWRVRRRCMMTYRWVVEGKRCSPDEIISIPSRHPLALRLVSELGQATYATNGSNKMVINKTPPGMRSPNLADAFVEANAKIGPPQFAVSPTTLRALTAGATRRGRLRRG